MKARQGDLDSLCGVYAIVNAFCHIAPLSGHARKRLFRHLICTLDEMTRLSDSVLEGINDKPFADLLIEAKHYAKNSCGIRIGIQKLPVTKRISLIRYSCLLRMQLQQPNSIAIVGIFGRLNHWTCITGVTDTAFLLLDSGGRKRLPFTFCRIRKRWLSDRYCLHPSITWIIKLKA